jgi:hypothetical protein
MVSKSDLNLSYLNLGKSVFCDDLHSNLWKRIGNHRFQVSAINLSYGEYISFPDEAKRLSEHHGLIL